MKKNIQVTIRNNGRHITKHERGHTKNTNTPHGAPASDFQGRRIDKLTSLMRVIGTGLESFIRRSGFTGLPRPAAADCLASFSNSPSLSSSKDPFSRSSRAESKSSATCTPAIFHDDAVDE